MNGGGYSAGDVLVGDNQAQGCGSPQQAESEYSPEVFIFEAKPASGSPAHQCQKDCGHAECRG